MYITQFWNRREMSETRLNQLFFISVSSQNGRIEKSEHVQFSFSYAIVVR